MNEVSKSTSGARGARYQISEIYEQSLVAEWLWRLLLQKHSLVIDVIKISTFNWDLQATSLIPVQFLQLGLISTNGYLFLQ